MTGRAVTGLDWPALMRAGLRGLRLTPEQFWSLTPHELGILLGLEDNPMAMNRDQLSALMARFPDMNDEV